MGGDSQKPIRASLSTVYGPKRGFPGSSDGKESASNAGDPALIPGSRRSPGEGNGNPLRYSCLENSMNRPWDHKESDSTEQLTLHFMGLKNRISDWEIRKNLESL